MLFGKITADDSLPKTVCADCCERIENYYSYSQLCSLSQHSLMKIFSYEGDPQRSENGVMYASCNKSITNNMPHGEESGISAISTVEVDRKDELNLNNKASNDTALEEHYSNLNQPLETNPTMPEGTSHGRKERGKNSSSECGSEEEEDIFNEATTAPVRNVFENYIWGCTLCNEELLSLPALKSHYTTVHMQQPVFKCMSCPKVYERYRSFARHVKLHQQIRPYSCDVCGKRFSQKTILQSHSTVHSEERPHVCSQCGKAFKQFSSLYLHSKCHLPEQAKPKYPCVICSKEYSTKYSMDTHMKIHTGERNYICDVCGKSFITKGSLDYHLLAHNETKPHSCLVCSKSFRTARLLAKHSTLHTGVKPYQCDVCGKQFRQRGGLKEHNRVHTGVMPYSCEYCGKTFRFRGILTIHKRQHTGERPYSCRDCVRVFTNWPNYNKHMKRRHKNNKTLGNDATPPEPPQIDTMAVVSTDFSEANDDLLFKNIPDGEIYRSPPPFNATIPFYISPVLSMQGMMEKK